MNATPSIESKQDIIDHLEQTVSDLVQAVNSGHLSPYDYPWISLAPVFRADADFPNQSGHELNLEGLLHTIKATQAANPEHYMRILTLRTHITNNNHADVAMTTEVHGTPAGVVRQNVDVFEFRKLKGQWRGVRYQGLRGMGGPQSESGGF